LSQPWLIYVLVFAAAVLAVQAAYALLFGARVMQKSVNRRLALSKELASAATVLDTLRQERGFADFGSPAATRLNDQLVQTGLRLGRNVLLLWLVALAVGLFLVASVIFGFGFLALVIGGGLAPLVILAYLKAVRRRRIARFTEQLPDAIDVIVRGVRVGHPLAVAVELVAREMPDPVGTEFGMMADEIAFGLDISTAVNNLYRRVGQDDLIFLIIAITVQSRTGGNLAEILSGLSQLMRSRAKLRLKIRAMTAEGRMSAWFLSAMPFVLFAVIQLISPHYFGDIRDHPFVEPALAYIALSLLIGNVMIYRMVRFKF
jgi:tight adherence protein B